MIKACLILMCNTGFFFAAAGICGAENVTLVIEHQVSNVTLSGDQYLDGVLYVWAPDSDIEEPLVFNFEGDTEINLELEAAGIYFFTAQTVVYNDDGKIVEYSVESDSVDYEVIESAGSIPADNERSAGESDTDDLENGSDDHLDPDQEPDDSSHIGDDTGDGSSRPGNTSIVAAGLGGSPCGCFVASMLTQQAGKLQMNNGW